MLDYYCKILQDGPPSLYQHITGHVRPGGQAGSSMSLDKVRVCLPADMYAGQLQLLGSLLPNLLQLWAGTIGLEVEGQPTASTGTDNMCCFGGSSSSTMGSSADNRLLDAARYPAEAVRAAGSLVLKLTEFLHPSSSGSAAAATAGQLCSLLESLSRKEVAVEQHCRAIEAAGPSCSSSSSSRVVPSKSRVCHVTLSLPTVIFQLATGGTTCTVGPLVDPIIAHSRPGSKPCMQLCSLLSTMLKSAEHDRRCGLHSAAGSDSRDPHARGCDIADSIVHLPLRAVLKVASALIDQATQKATARQAAGNSRSGNGSSKAAASPSHVAGVMSLFALLGRTCLELGDQAVTGDSVPYVSDDIAATMNYHISAVARVSTGWMFAGSNAAQAASMGYDTDGVLECLQVAAMVSDAARSTQDANPTPLDSLVPQLQEQVYAVGRVLTSFAHPNACNNPACATLSGPSESSLVQGSSSKCSSCRAARYCSKSCQRVAWKQHKQVCKALAAAAAAAAGKCNGTS